MSHQLPFVKIAALLLLAGTIVGCITTLLFPAAMESAFAAMFQVVQDLGEKIFQEQTPLQGTVTLFWHNFRAVLGMVVFGLALGIFPLLGIVLNGALLGVVLALSLAHGQVLAFVVGILPHGVFEIPALVIGAGTGMYLGWGPFKKSWHGYKDAIKSCLDPVLLVVGLLVAAAIVEVNITPVLLNLVLR